MHTVVGQRVERIRDLKVPGDYCVKYIGDEIDSVWFAMPGFPAHLWNRINGPGSTEKVRWEVTEDDDGRVTVDPSIKSVWTEGMGECVFHAFLKNGVWEILDDTIGANFNGKEKAAASAQGASVQ